MNTYKLFVLLFALSLPHLIFAQGYEKYNSIGTAYLKKGNLDSAEACFIRSVNIQPTTYALLKLSTINIKKGIAGSAVVYAHEVLMYAGDDYNAIAKSFFDAGLAYDTNGEISFAIVNYKMSLVARSDSNAKKNLLTDEAYLSKHYTANDFSGKWIAYDYELSPGEVGTMDDDEAKKLLNKTYVITGDSIRALGQRYSLEYPEYIRCDPGFKESFDGYTKIIKLFAGNYSKKMIQLDVDNGKEFNRFIFINDNTILTGMDGNYFFLKRQQ